jgi:hypothetical protein
MGEEGGASFDHLVGALLKYGGARRNRVSQDKWHQGFCSKLKRNALIVMNVDEGGVLNGARGKAYYVNEQRTCRPKVV